MFACVLCDIPMATACVHFCARSLPSELERLKLLGVKPKSVTVAWVDVVIYVGRQGGFAKEPHGVPRDFRRLFWRICFRRGRRGDNDNKAGPRSQDRHSGAGSQLGLTRFDFVWL